jgi:hypothetical protein
MPAVPATLAEITPDWLTATLSERLPGTVVADAEVAPLHDIANYNGTLARVRLKYASQGGDAPDSLVAKLVPENERMLHLGTSLGVYRREAALYSVVGPATGVRLPNLFGFSEDTESGISALLLEDLSRLRTGDQYIGFTLAEAEAALVQFARQHATWWDRPELGTFAWLPAWNEPAMIEFAATAYAQIWPACAAAFEDILPAEAVALGGRLADILGDLMNDAAVPPVTLVHGDARHENLMFDPADESAAPYVIDWQLTARGRGVMDVAYYLTQSGPAELAAAHERALVERYHEELCLGGVRDYSVERCWEDYRRFAYYALVYPVFAAGFMDPENDEQRAAISVILGRAVSAILRLDAAEFC